jgi:hypothetical protein
MFGLKTIFRKPEQASQRGFSEGFSELVYSQNQTETLCQIFTVKTVKPVKTNRPYREITNFIFQTVTIFTSCRDITII